MKLIFFFIIAIFSSVSLIADTFEVTGAVLGKPVQYNNRYLQNGDIINGNTPIELNDDNVITVLNLSKSNRTYIIAGNKFKKHKCKNFGEYFSKAVGAVTRSDKAIESLHQMMDSTLFWTDNVCIPTLYEKNPNRIFAIDIMDALEEYHEVILPSFDGGKGFFLPQKSLYPTGEIRPLIIDFKIGLKESETEKINFDTVIRNIILIPIKK